MAETLADARDLVARAKAAGRIHAVVQNRRYLAGVRRIARAVRSGAIGAITSVHADFFLAPHFGGFREEMDHVLLLDMAIHGFDALRCMTGLAASGVYCREWNPPQSWYRQGSSAAAIFELENGAVFVYRGSWCAQGLPTSWECAWRFVGAKGALTWDGSDQIRIEVLGSGERKGLFDPMTTVEPPPLAPEDRVDGHFGVLSDFVSAVRVGERTGNRRPRQHSFARHGARRHRERRCGPAGRHRHLDGTSMRALLDIRIGTMIRANAPDPATYVRRDRRTWLRKHRAFLLADDEQGSAAAGRRAARGDRRRRRDDRYARHVRQSARGRRSRSADACRMGSADRQRAPFRRARRSRASPAACAASRSRRACRSSRRSGAS